MIKKSICHISPILDFLYWLLVKSRIKFEILLLANKVLNKQVQSYVKDIIIPIEHVRALFVQATDLWLLEFLKVEWEAEL